MKRIALFMHEPACAAQCTNGIIKALEGSYTFKLFGKNSMEEDFFEDVDMVCFPGGIGDSDQFTRVLRNNIDVVQSYIKSGGRYLGICMGAYWAGSNYFDILKDVDAEQYIAQPGTCTRRPHPKAIMINWLGNLDKMYFYDGCTFIGSGEAEVVATYPTGYPAAIIQDKIGLIGVHPESEKYWYDERSYMVPHWHHNRHHKWLLDFVNEIMSR